jgi:Na+-translocating ferredoxin:NAD+ oxidoreductase RnfD subunit
MRRPLFYVNVAFFIGGLIVLLVLAFSGFAWWIPAAWFAFLVVMAIDAIFFPSRERPRD